VRKFTEDQVLEIIDDAFHTLAIDSRWAAQDYVKEKFFTSTNTASMPCLMFAGVNEQCDVFGDGRCGSVACNLARHT